MQIKCYLYNPLNESIKKTRMGEVHLGRFLGKFVPILIGTWGETGYSRKK